MALVMVVCAAVLKYGRCLLGLLLALSSGAISQLGLEDKRFWVNLVTEFKMKDG